MELKGWIVVGKKKSFWGKETQRWTVGAVDTVTEAHQNVNMLNKWSEDQIKRLQDGMNWWTSMRRGTDEPANWSYNPPLLLCPWDVKWTLSDAKRVEYSFEPLFAFPNYYKEL